MAQFIHPPIHSQVLARSRLLASLARSLMHAGHERISAQYFNLFCFILLFQIAYM